VARVGCGVPLHPAGTVAARVGGSAGTIELEAHGGRRRDPYDQWRDRSFSAKTEAIRALGRRLSDEVFRRLHVDEAASASVRGVARAAA
jgi:hypothetical protein